MCLTDLWAWVTAHGVDEVLVRTIVREADLAAVSAAFRMNQGRPENLTATQAWERRQHEVVDFNDPPYQLRLCPLGRWTLAIEDGTAIHLLPWSARDSAPSFRPGTPGLRVAWTLTTGLCMEHWSGVAGEPRSWLGDSVGPPTGYLADIADRLGIVHGEPHADDHARVLAAVADDLGISPVPVEVVLGPLPTVTRHTPMR